MPSVRNSICAFLIGAAFAALPSIAAAADMLWCRYRDAERTLLFDKQCDFEFNGTSANCADTLLLDGSYNLTFADRFAVRIVPVCPGEGVDGTATVNGEAAFMSWTEVNGRSYLTASLADGREVDFVPASAAAKPDLAPWSEAALKAGTPGSCFRGIEQYDLRKGCTRHQVCNENDESGEQECRWEFALAHGERLVMNQVEQSLVINGKEIRSRDVHFTDTATCYPVPGEKLDFCFEPARIVPGRGELIRHVGEFDGWCFTDSGCVGSIPIKNDSFDQCEQNCIMSNPTGVRGLDATLYDVVCEGDMLPTPSKERMLFLKYRSLGGQMAAVAVGPDGPQQLTQCE